MVCAFSPRESILAFSTGTSLSQSHSHPSVRLWNPEIGQNVGEDLALPDTCRGLAFSGDGRTLATFTADDRLTLWRVPEGMRLASFHTPLQLRVDTPLAVALSSDAH